MRVLANFIGFLLLLQSTYANAVVMHHHRGGDVLIFPFFNVEQGWDSLLTVATAAKFSGGGKFVDHPGVFRVRIRDAISGERVKSFTVYNTKIVNWRVSLSKNANGQTTLRVAEGDCLITDNNEVLAGEDVEVRFPSTTGIIEIFAIGQLNNTVESCAEITNKWKPGGRWDINSADGMSQAAPITGELLLVNVAQGVAVSYSATTLGDFTDKNLHSAPDTDFPTLADAQPVAHLNNGKKVVPQTQLGIDAVAMVLGLGEQATLANDVIVLDEIGARTDWIVSYPLAGYKSYRPFAIENNSKIFHCEAFGDTVGGLPTVRVDIDRLSTRLISEGARRRRGGDPIEVEITPAPEHAYSGIGMCNAVNVLSFEGGQSVLLPSGSLILSDLSNVTVSPTNSLTWKLIEPVFPPDSGIRRPVLAYSLTTFVNGRLDGGRVLANYAILRPHRRE